MPIVTVLPSNKTVEVATGTTLRDAILASGEKFPSAWGKGCALCHVFVPAGKKTLSKAQKSENEKLDAIVGVGSNSRLACDALVGEAPVSVEILSFASG